MPDMRPLFEIALWAAGAQEAPPVAADIDAAAMLQETIEQHKLMPRLRLRLRELPQLPAWCSVSLQRALEEEAARAEEQLLRNVEVLRELAGRLPEPPIAIKGFSLYALTGDPAHRHESGDIDIFAPDEEACVQALIALGFAGSRRSREHHEYAGLGRGEVYVEVHRHFPIWSFPAGIFEADLDPAHHPGRWVQDFAPPAAERVRDTDLREGALSGCTDATRGILVPDPAMAALILCAHEARNLINSPFTKPTPAARLARLADLNDLARHPEFRPARFRALVERFRARDAVLPALRLLRVYFGETSSAATALAAAIPGASKELAPNAAGDALPRWLADRGMWAAVHTAGDPIALPPGDTLLRRLAPNPVRLPAERRGESLAITPERVLVHRMGGREDLPFSLTVTADDLALTFDVRFEQLLEPETSYHLCLHGAAYTDLVHEVTVRRQGAELQQKGHGMARLRRDPDGRHTVRLSLPRTRIVRDGSPATLALVLATQPHGSMHADIVLLVPLEI